MTASRIRRYGYAQRPDPETRVVPGGSPIAPESRISEPLTNDPRIVGQTAKERSVLPELKNFRLKSDTTTERVYTWDADAFTAQVWAGSATFPLPAPLNPWDIVTAGVEPLAAGATEFSVPKPMEGLVTYAQIEARGSDLTPGDVWQLEVNAPASQPPLVAFDDVEDDLGVTQWLQFVTRGLDIVDVQLRQQIGTNPIGAFHAPTRGPGAASTVKGGLLGALDYEEDLVRDDNRESYIDGFATLSNGERFPIGPISYQRNKRPKLMSLVVRSSTIVDLAADIDTKSLRLSNPASGWEYQLDGVSATIDVSKIGTNGIAGLGAGASATFTAEARSEPTSDVDVDTLIDSRTVVIAGGAAPPPTASWDTPGVVGTAPAIGDSAMTITLKATAAPAGWSVKVYINGFDHTADLAPPGGAVPVVNTNYTYDTDFVRIAGGEHAVLHSFTVQADLLDGGGAVIDTRTVYISWYSGNAV